jgi:PHD/YefM family antitoxin component YafN of YafNO toxin-antitoxin module
MAMKVATRRKSSGYGPGESPALLVQENGVAAYLVEAKSYEAMQRRLRLLEGLARGEKAIAEGRVVSHSRAKKRLARWLK